MGFIRAEVEDFLGRGITLPLRLVNGSVPLDSGSDLIKSSIKMILLWLKGTRFFLAEFGSRVEELLEEPNDDVLKHLAYTMIADALNQWEKGIQLIDVEITRPDFAKLDVKIIYKIITSERVDSFTFPFYSIIKT